MTRYRVAQVGVGNRGMVHLDGFLSLPERYEVVGVCDLDQARMKERLGSRSIPATFTAAEEMLARTKPDVFCFVTQPDLRLAMVELAVKYGVKALAFEKPMATSLHEARAIRELCRRHGLKAVVSHQQKYLTSLQRVKATVDAGEIGTVTLIEAHCQAWLSQLGTHYMDYILWVNGGRPARWAVGHAHGREKLADNHPSPDFTFGMVEFDNGVRAMLQCGYLAPKHMVKEAFWVDNRLIVHGTHGYAWGDTEGHFEAFTRRSGGEVIVENGPGYNPAKPFSGWCTQERSTLQRDYLAELADWLDDDRRVHSCNVDTSYHGYEILEAMGISALDNNRVDLPLDPDRCADLNERLGAVLPETPKLG